MKKPSIQLVKYNDEVFKAVFKNVPVEITNSLRRVMMAEVPTIAVEEVIIFKNDGFLNDDSLAHRLGLIPLKTDIGTVRRLREGDGYVTLNLKVAARTTERTVYSGDLKSRDRAVGPVSDKIEIAKLAPGQAIEAEMWAVPGIGEDHAKWSPVTVAVARGVPKIRLAKEIPQDVAKGLVEVCPKNVFEAKGGEVRIVDITRCTVCGICEEKYGEFVKIGIDEGSSILYFESVGQLTTKEILDEAFNILLSKLDEFKNKFMEVELDVA